jgi:hypothetical protein
MKPQQAVRIAMWSGPRNISTAMMRSWGNRPDTYVCDEPLYAHYLIRHPVDHPGVGEVIAHHEQDWRKVVAWLTGPVPDGKTVFYQKQMTHHLLANIDRSWLDSLVNCFLIREPKEMLTSLIHHMPRPTLADTGLPQQVELFQRERERTGRVPPVLDSRDVLENPERILRLLCKAVALNFTAEMLHWPPGRRDTDGVWAKHWYGAVERSTGFRPYQPKNEPVPQEFAELHRDCLDCYELLHAHRLGI